MKPRPAATRHIAHVLIALLLGTGIALRVIDLPVAVYTPDEDAYANFYATPMFVEGPGVLPRLVRDYNFRREMHVFPSPTRVGHLWAIVAFMNLLGRASILNAAWASAAASMLILLLVARLGLRYLNSWATAAALLFATFSPLDRAMARRVWGDELFAALALLSLLAFLAWATGGRRARWLLLCLASAAYSLLVKETGLVVLGLAGLGLAIVAWRAEGPRAAGVALLASAGALAAAVGVLALACGGIDPLRATLARAAAAESGNAYMLKYQTGGPGYYARGLMLLAPVPAILGLVGAIGVALRTAGRHATWAPPRTRAALVTLTVFTLVLVALALAWPQKNLRFLSPVYAPMALLAGEATWVALAATRGRLPATARLLVITLAVVGLVAAAVADQRRFVEYFVRRGIPDLATPWFTAAP